MGADAAVKRWGGLPHGEKGKSLIIVKARTTEGTSGAVSDMVAGRFRHWVNRLQTSTRETGRPPEDWHGELTWRSSPRGKALVAVTEGRALSGRRRGEAAGGATGALRSRERRAGGGSRDHSGDETAHRVATEEGGGEADASIRGRGLRMRSQRQTAQGEAPFQGRLRQGGAMQLR